MKNIRRIISFLSLGLLVASIIQELRLPPDERTWHGQVAGVIPYDLRLPSLDRVWATFWNPDETHILVPTVFGVGWSVNLFALVARLAG